MLNGGHGENALPQSAGANVNCRIFPGVKIEDVRLALQQAAGSGVEVKLVGEPLSSDASPLRPDVRQGRDSCRAQASGPACRWFRRRASGATDGLVFRSVGIPTYGVDGNFMKSEDDFSHGLNERLGVQSFYDSLTFWHTLVTDLAGKRR